MWPPQSSKHPARNDSFDKGATPRLNDNRRWQIADNTVYLDAKHPSRIVLPVFPAQ
jgi:hypothetical protein